MVEKWLDNKALELLKQAGKMDDDVSEIPKLISQKKDEDDEEILENKNYDPVKLDVVLPITNEIEQIEYITPKIGDESKNISKSANPQFKEFKPHFDVFELISPVCIPSIPDN